ncbi:MAG: zinc-ribbon domain-containing protein [Acidobacteriota bacterium]
MLYCSQCGTQNREGSKFCNNCGARLKPASGAICPMCGTANQVETVFCTNCGARLVPLTAEPDSEKPASAHPIKGLSLPTKIPPSPAHAEQETPSPASAVPEEPAHDETQTLRDAPPPSESREESGSGQDVTTEGETEIPDWLRNLRSSMPVEETSRPSPVSETGPVQAGGEGEDQVPDWLARLRAEPPAEEEPAARQVSEDAPDWIKQLQAQEQVPVPPRHEEDVPDWLRQLHAEASSEMTLGGEEQASGAPSGPAAETGLEQDTEEPESREPFPREIKSDAEITIPSWIEHAAGIDTEEPAPAEGSELPVWLDQSSLESPVQPSPVQDEPPVPAPIDQLGEEVEPPKTEDQAALPSWLLPSTPEETPPETPTWIEQVPALPAAEEPAPVPATDGEIPDWIKELQAREPAEAPAETIPEIQGAETESLIQSLEQDAGAEIPLVPAEAAGLEKPLEEEIPDWLRLAMPAERAAEISAEAEAPEEKIEAARPEEVPAWIAALRPKDEVALTPAELAGEPSEEVGPLAGLRGVLPLAVAVAEPHVQTKAAAQPQAPAGVHLFDSILAAPAGEAELPAAKGRRALAIRPFIYLLLTLAVIVPLLLPFSLARSMLPIRRTPAEGFYELLQGLPSSSTVLVAFDYDASMAGEMDLQANAIVRDLIRRRIKIIAVSTLELGPQIAQRILDTAAAGVPNYRYGSDFVNAGYLAGHEAGLSQLATSGLSANSVDFVQKQKLGSLPITANIKSMRNVALVVELAGSEDSLKMWMEQVQPRGGAHIAAGVSAGVEPKAQAYYDAKQIDAVLSGLVGAAQYEILSNQPGLAVTSVDAQSAAHVVLVLIIVLGNIAYWVSRARGSETARASRGKAT